MVILILLIDGSLATKNALADWSNSAPQEENVNNISSTLTTQIELAKDYLDSGHLPQARALLEKTILSLETAPNVPLEYTAHLYLGHAYLLQGDYTRALDNYLESGQLASNRTASLVVLNNLSLAYYRQGRKLLVAAEKSSEYDESLSRQQQQESQKMLEAARTNARRARELALTVPPSLSSVRAWLNWPKISGELHNIQPKDYSQQLQILRSLPPSSSKARLLIEMADYTTKDKVTTLKAAIATAEAEEDYATLSWAWGALGAWALEQGQTVVALEQTKQALLAAERIFATDIIYRWQWQLGRIYRVLGQKELAALQYEQALSSLFLMKEDLLIAIRNKQVDFDEQIEPIYRQYLQLLLEKSDEPKAWLVAELLAKAELESYFGDDCFDLKESRPLPSNVAVIRSIMVADNLYLMLKLPSEEIKVFPIKIALQDLNNSLEQWRYQLEFPKDNSYRLIGRQLYELLIQPLVPDLARIDHLVFINDGLLRTVPMAALYNGQQHLIEQYSISYAVSSDLAISQSSNHYQLLAFGLSAPPAPAPALPTVKRELLAIQQILRGNFMENKDFTLSNLDRELAKDYSLLHLATHSSFGGSKESTYLQAYDRNISLLELEQILLEDKSVLQLLVLSGCETALGEQDALLGLAGIGIRTGVANTIGSVWAVNSDSTADLFVDFYQNYTHQKMISSEALRLAQIQFIERKLHPYYWSGFMNIY